MQANMSVGMRASQTSPCADVMLGETQKGNMLLPGILRFIKVISSIVFVNVNSKFLILICMCCFFQSITAIVPKGRKRPRLAYTCQLNFVNKIIQSLDINRLYEPTSLITSRNFQPLIVSDNRLSNHFKIIQSQNKQYVRFSPGDVFNSYKPIGIPFRGSHLWEYVHSGGQPKTAPLPAASVFGLTGNTYIHHNNDL